MKTAKPATYPPSDIKVSLFLVVVMILSFAAQSAWAKTAEEIDAGVYVCLERFYHQIKGGREMVAMAEGVLVVPDVVKAGFIVGGEFGEGALRVGGKTASYYIMCRRSPCKRLASSRPWPTGDGLAFGRSRRGGVIRGTGREGGGQQHRSQSR